MLYHYPSTIRCTSRLCFRATIVPYINGHHFLRTALRRNKYVTYADDILIYKPILNETSYDALQQDINKISELSKTYHMHFNPAKCKCMLLTQKSNPHSHALTLNGEILEMVTQYKYLGVTISSDLHWTPHIKQICSNAKKLVGLIYRNFATNKIQNPYLVLTLYLSLVRPCLEYAS